MNNYGVRGCVCVAAGTGRERRGWLPTDLETRTRRNTAIHGPSTDILTGRRLPVSIFPFIVHRLILLTARDFILTLATKV